MKCPAQDLIATVEEVPPLVLPFAKILSPKPGKPVKAIIVNARPVQVYTHYVHGRTQPHLRDRSLCEGCQLARKRQYKCYFGAWVLPDDAYCLIELTHYAADAWRKRIGDETFDFRGALVTVYRLGRGTNGRCRCEFEWEYRPKDKLPQPLPIMDVLRAVWGGDTQTKRVRDGLDAQTCEEVPL